MIAVLCVLATACSDDSTSTSNNTNNSNNSNNSNNTADAGPDTAPELDAELDSPADTAPDLNDAGQDVEQDAGQDAEQDVFMFPDADVDPCAFPSADPTCPDGPYGPGSFITALQIPEQPTCCFDYTGDGVIDNKIGSLLSIARGLGFDVNAGLTDAIANGQLINLLGYANVQNAEFDADLDVAFYKGADADFDFGLNLLGLGDFLILVESLNADTSPRWTFGSAQIRNSLLDARDGQIDLDFPDLLDQVRIPVIQGRIEATILPGADLRAAGRITLDQGKMGGVVLRDEFFQSLNDASQACFCLAKDVYERQADGSYDCVSTPDDEIICQGASAGCQFLARQQYCGLLGTAISNAVDVDTDGDNLPDSYSFGATFTGVGASILGDAPL
jgi:hypothetical protein